MMEGIKIVIKSLLSKSLNIIYTLIILGNLVAFI